MPAERDPGETSTAGFKDGDLVYHAHHGAGTVICIQKVNIGGSSQSYYVVELASGSKLMLPVTQAGQICSLRTLKAISEVLSATPEDLAVDYRQRRTGIEEKINSGDQLESAEVFRDLAWRAHNAQLSGTDREVMNNMRKRLIDILSVQADLDIREAAQWLELKLQKITRSWSALGEGTGEIA
jgi:RNA polymerase-interacting CarD/CdnL/TRCF family regulator